MERPDIQYISVFLKVESILHDIFVLTWIRKRRRRKRKRGRKRRGSLTMASQRREVGTLVKLFINETPTTGAGLTRKGGALGKDIELFWVYKIQGVLLPPLPPLSPEI